MPELDRSPLKGRPLRQAGQSLEEERRAIWDDKLEPAAITALMLTVFAGVEWLRELLNVPPTPIITSIAALLAIAYALWRFIRLRPLLRQLRQGIDGEKIVGQYLEGLRSGGYRVFHDVVGSNFNIDHVVIGPAGAFTVETKTWSKPLRGSAKITFDGGQLMANGRAVDRDPIVQARAQASWLRDILQESTGKSIYVHPVVVFPNWFVEQPTERLKGIWVLEPKALPAYLEREPERLESSDVALAASHLSRFIRSEQQGRRGRV